jgi:maleate cis-trans isomerase
MNTKPTIGFISAPAWFDPAPYEFHSVVKEEVQTQQAPLLLPKFDYKLESIASVQKELNHNAISLASIGCDLVAQVGSPFSWACVKSEAEARNRNTEMEKVSGIPSVMTGLAIIDGLRKFNVHSIAVNCTYYDDTWCNSFRYFLEICGFHVLGATTLSSQGLVPNNIQMHDYGWSMTDELTEKSIDIVAKNSPTAQAMVITGAGTRTLNLLEKKEAEIQVPIISADTVLYWAIAEKLNLSLESNMGMLSKL